MKQLWGLSSPRISAIVQSASKSKGLRTKGVDGINSRRRAGEDEMRCPSSSSEAVERGE